MWAGQNTWKGTTSKDYFHDAKKGLEFSLVIYFFLAWNKKICATSLFVTNSSSSNFSSWLDENKKIKKRKKKYSILYHKAYRVMNSSISSVLWVYLLHQLLPLPLLLLLLFLPLSKRVESWICDVHSESKNYVMKVSALSVTVIFLYIYKLAIKRMKRGLKLRKNKKYHKRKIIKLNWHTFCVW